MTRPHQLLAGKRILVLTNLYPPLSHGGYEVECKGVVDHLRQTTEVLVLTSGRGRGKLPPEPGVRRELPLIPRRRINDALSAAYALRGVEVARRALREIRPDVVYVWNGAQLPQATIRVLETGGAALAYRVCEQWFGKLYQSRYDPFMRGLTGGRWRRSARALNRLPALRVDYSTRVEAGISWNSEALRRQVEAPALVEPIFERVRLPATWQSEELVGLARRPSSEPTIGYVGRVSPEKGIDVAIRALPELPEASLEIAGPGSEAHRRALTALAEELGVGDRIAFLGPLDVDRLKRFYAAIHLLVVPSVWEEPAGLVVVEGALAGVPLVASAVGGIPEIVRDRQEALLCPAGDPSALARAIRETLGDSDGAAARAERARERAGAFRMAPYLDAMDEFIADVVRARSVAPVGS